MTQEFTKLELARDEVSNAAAAWVAAATEGGEETAIARFDAALTAFEKVVREDGVGREPSTGMSE